MSETSDSKARPRRPIRTRIVLGVAIVAMTLGLVYAGGFFGSGDSSNPLDPTFFGAGTADSPYCHQTSGFWLQWVRC